MKRLNVVFVAVVTLSMLLGSGFSYGEKVLPSYENTSKNKILDVEYAKELETIEEEVSRIYEKSIGEIGTELKTKLMDKGIKTAGELSSSAKEELKSNEIKTMIAMHEEIDKLMEKNGWIKQHSDEELKANISSTGGQISVTGTLHYDPDRGYYTYRGYWNFDNNAHDRYEDAVDVLAVRSSKDLISRNTSYVYSYDQYGYSHHSNAWRSNWEADGAIFQIRDHVEESIHWEPYFNDNGYVVFTFKALKGSEIYTHYEHNFQTGSLKPVASIDLMDLSNSKLSVDYTKTNRNWQKVSNPSRANGG